MSGRRATADHRRHAATRGAAAIAELNPPRRGSPRPPRSEPSTPRESEAVGLRLRLGSAWTLQILRLAGPGPLRVGRVDAWSEA